MKARICSVGSVFFFFWMIFSSFALEDVVLTPVSLVTCEWAPFYGSDLPDQGFFTKIVRESFENVGYELDVTFFPWTTAMKLAQSNEYDGLMGAYYSRAREVDFMYSKPIYLAKNLFIARKGMNIKYNGDLHNLEGFRVGISKGYTYTEEFDEAEYLTKVVATCPETCVQLILSNHVDLILIQHDKFLDIIDGCNGGLKGLVALGPSLVEKPLFVATSRTGNDHQRIIECFNEGFRQLVQSGRYNQIIQMRNKQD